MTQETALQRIRQAKDTHAETLDLSKLNLESLPAELWELTQLKELSLSRNQLTGLPSAIGNLAHLEILSIGVNQLASLPQELFALAQLKVLSLGSNQLTDLPPAIGSLAHLERLDLGGNQLASLPPELFALAHLEKLDLGGNQLASLPPELFALAQLKELRLWSNQLTDLPPAIGNLAHLEILYLSVNQLAFLPPELFALAQLKELYLGSNQLTDLPPAIGNLAHLEILVLGYNQLAFLPPELFALAQLKVLSLGSNQLTDLPPAIGNLAHLEILSIGNNQLAFLPPELFALAQLKELDLYENQLTDLPPAIGNLANLKDLDLHINQLNVLPHEILNLRALERLNLNDTPLAIALPAELLGRFWEGNNAQPILDFYEKLWAEGGRPLGEARVLVVGQPSVGKTSLVRRLMDGTYDDKEKSTMTVEMRVLPTGECQALVWDFGGQEYMHATHPFFFSRRCLYLLVINVRNEKDHNRLEYWLQTIRSYGEDSPVIIVGNQADRNQHKLDIPKNRLQREYPNIQAFVETSAQDNLGIEELRAAIIAQMESMPQVRVELPVSYLAVKETLEAEKRDIISLDRYAELCKQNNVTDKTNQDNLLALLHDMGTVFCFKDEKGQPVSEIGVLNPNWVTQGVYKVLTSEKIRAGVKGKLTTQMLDEILSDYAARHRRLIADLMKRFELCYPADDSTYWLPNAMEQDEPAQLGDWASALTFEYQYPELPESVITRFIVKTHVWIRAAQVWRYGVILEKDGNAALVRADTGKKRAVIQVTGRENTRRDFLAQLRGHFDEIHKPFAEPPPAFIYPPQYPELPISFEKLKTFERDNVPDFYEDYKGKAVKINVRETLDGFTTPAERQKERGRESSYDDRAPREVHYHDHKHIEVGRDVVGGVLNMGDENQITQNITHAAELKESMEALVKETQEVLKRLAESDAKEELKDNLERLQSEMQKSKPKKEWYEVSVKGLIQAAENLNDLGKPVISLAGKVLKLLLGAGDRIA
jgi:small GTP-binding protein